jgi:hypothetical protein
VVMACAAGVSSDSKKPSTVEVCRVNLSLTCARWVGATLAAVTVAGTSVLIVPPLVDLSSVEAAHASLSRGAMKASPVVIELAAALPSPQLASVECLPPCKRGSANIHSSVPAGLAANHLLSLHWVGPRSSSSTGGDCKGIFVGSLPLLHHGFRALLGAVSYDIIDGDITQQYAEAASAAAQWASLLPAHSQASLSHHLNCVGNPLAALLLPEASPMQLISVALRTRAEVFSKTFPTRISIVDALAAVSTVVHLVNSVSGEDLLFLSTPQLHEFSVPRVESSSSVASVWSQVAAYLAVAAHTFPAFAPSIRSTITVLADRLTAIGVPVEAAVVASVLPSKQSFVSEDTMHGTEAEITSADLLVRALKFGGPAVALFKAGYSAALSAHDR